MKMTMVWSGGGESILLRVMDGKVKEAGEEPQTMENGN
jgi:hypothetical protein